MQRGTEKWRGVYAQLLFLNNPMPQEGLTHRARPIEQQADGLVPVPRPLGPAGCRSNCNKVKLRFVVLFPLWLPFLAQAFLQLFKTTQAGSCLYPLLPPATPGLDPAARLTHSAAMLPAAVTYRLP